MIKLVSDSQVTPAKMAKVGCVYRVSYSRDIVMRVELENSKLSIEGDTWGCSVLFVNILTGKVDYYDSEACLEYVGAFQEEGDDYIKQFNA